MQTELDSKTNRDKNLSRIPGYPANSDDEVSCLRSEIERLQGTVESLTQKLHDANNDLLWVDLIAARHAEAYATAETGESS
jgi:hypothetical protein